MTATDRVRTTASPPARRPAPPALARALTLALTLALLVAAAPTRAAALPTATTPSQTLSIPLTDTNWMPGQPASIPDPLPFARFDPTLGTLQSVTLTLGYSIQ